MLRFPVKSIHTSSTIFGKLSDIYDTRCVPNWKKIQSIFCYWELFLQISKREKQRYSLKNIGIRVIVCARNYHTFEQIEEYFDFLRFSYFSFHHFSSSWFSNVQKRTGHMRLLPIEIKIHCKTTRTHTDECIDLYMYKVNQIYIFAKYKATIKNRYLSIIT